MAFAVLAVPCGPARTNLADAQRSQAPAPRLSRQPKRRYRGGVLRACAQSSSKVENLSGSEINSATEAKNDTPPGDPEPSTPSLRTAAIGALYVLFVVHNIGFGPGSLLDPGTIGQILSGKTQEVNDLVIAVFYGLGVIGNVYGGLLAAGAGKQKRLNTALFSIAGCILGFFGVGPYLAGREYAPVVSREELSRQGPVVKVFESKGFALGTLGLALYVYVTGLGLLAPSEMRDVIFYSCWQDTARLFASDRGIHATLLDGALLSVLMWGPLTEDMRRRGWVFDNENKSSFVNALSILAAPCLGPALYLLLRPQLPSETKKPGTDSG